MSTVATAASPSRIAALAGIVVFGVAATYAAFGAPAAAFGADLFRPASLSVAFLAGLATGSHCIGMCGGFVLCFAAGRNEPGAHVRYALAKTASYMAIGALCGLLGHTISATGRWPWIAAIVAGIFLLAFGAHLLGWPIWPEKFRLTRFDRAAGWLRERARQSASPIGLGLANGLMLGCGPLLAMYAAAAGTGSPRQGAALLGAFGLGTLPLMLASTWIASAVLGNFRRTAARWSGLIVVVGGLLMLQRGIALANSAPLAPTSTAAALAPRIMLMAATADGWTPDRFTVEKGQPIKWIINGHDASACTARLRLPVLDHEIVLGRGETVVEFTPTETGELPWTCWMGMARGHFTVIERSAAYSPTR